jgi:hypothetical protein
MSEQEELFTKDQNRLMNIAGWANNLAWVTLVAYLILAALTIFLDQANYQRMQAMTSGFANASNYWEIARADPFYYFLTIGSDILSRALAGFMYYVILKGISLGLYMVIETNMNYREKEKQGGEL